MIRPRACACTWVLFDHIFWQKYRVWVRSRSCCSTESGEPRYLFSHNFVINNFARAQIHSCQLQSFSVTIGSIDQAPWFSLQTWLVLHHGWRTWSQQDPKARSCLVKNEINRICPSTSLRTFCLAKKRSNVKTDYWTSWRLTRYLKSLRITLMAERDVFRLLSLGQSDYASCQSNTSGQKMNTRSHQR